MINRLNQQINKVNQQSQTLLIWAINNINKVFEIVDEIVDRKSVGLYGETIPNQHNQQLKSLVAKIRELEGLGDKYNSLKLPKWPNENNLLAYAYAREAFQGGTK